MNSKDNWPFIIGLGVIALIFGYGAIADPDLGPLRWICACPAALVLTPIALILLLEQLGVVNPDTWGRVPQNEKEQRKMMRDIGISEEEINEIMSSDDDE